MKSRKVKLLILLLVLFQSSVFAQMGRGGRRGMGMRPPSFMMIGIRTGYDYHAEVWGAGGQFRLPLGRSHLIPSGDIFSIDGKIDWQINLDASLRLMMFYGGLGLAILNRDFDRPGEANYKAGFNYFIGLPLPLPLWRFRLLPYIEARWTEVNKTRIFRLVVGVNFLLSRRR